MEIRVLRISNYFNDLKRFFLVLIVPIFIIRTEPLLITSPNITVPNGKTLSRILSPTLPKSIAFTAVVSFGVLFFAKTPPKSFTKSPLVESRIAPQPPAPSNPPPAPEYTAPAVVKEVAPKKRKVSRRRQNAQKQRRALKLNSKKPVSRVVKRSVPAQSPAVPVAQPIAQAKSLDPIPAPIDPILSEGFQESPLNSPYGSDPFVSEAQLDTQFLLDWKYPLLAAFEGFQFEVIRNEYQNEREALRVLKEEFASLAPTPKSAPKIEEEKNYLVSVPEPKKAPSVVSHKPQKNVLVAKNPKVEVAKTYDGTEKNILIAPRSTQAARSIELSKSEEPPQEIHDTPSLLQDLSVTEVPTQRVASSEATAPQRMDTAPEVSEATLPQVNTQLSVVNQVVENSPVARLYGKLEWESSKDRVLREAIDHKNGFLELSLRPLNNRNALDVVRVDGYRFPDTDFEVDTTPLSGRYYLVASLYVPDRLSPLKQYYHPTPVDASSRQYIRFGLDQDHSSPEVAKTPSEKSTIVATVFEGASGNYRESPHIPHASVRLLSRGVVTEYQSDAQGNVRIPGMPRDSEAFVTVAAAGYHPTETVIPISKNDVYLPIYLVPKGKVQTITEFFTRRPQKERAAVVMTRAFDPHTRRPKSGVSAELSQRRGRAVYFGEFPDLDLVETTSLGLLAFFNITPFARILSREGAAPYLLHPRAGSGYYLEFGRGGEKDLWGVLKDPFNKTMPQATVRMVGDEGEPIFTDEKNRFVLPKIDQPMGVVLVETEAEGYPKTWHTLSVNVKEPARLQSLFMMEEDVIDQLAAIAHVKLRPGFGNLAGGLAGSLFKDSNSCVKVSVFDEDGTPVSSEFGPFSSLSEASGSEDFCLTRTENEFGFLNLPPKRYLLRLYDNEGFEKFHVVHVGADRLSVVVN